MVNRLLDKKPVSEYPIGRICRLKWWSDAHESAINQLRKDSGLKEKLEKLMKKRLNRISPIEKMEPFNCKKNELAIFNKILDQEQTEILTRALKENKLSVNSGVVCMLENSLLQLAKRKDIDNDIIEFLSLHALSMRRFDEEDKEAFGFQAGILNLSTEISDLKDSQMVKHGQKIGRLIREQLNDKAFILESANIFLEREKQENPYPKLQTPEHACYDYCVSNLGDITYHFAGVGKHVQVESVLRSSNTIAFGVCFTVFLHTFRGRLHFTFMVNNNFMSKEVGHELIDEFMGQINDFGS